MQDDGKNDRHVCRSNNHQTNDVRIPASASQQKPMSLRSMSLISPSIIRDSSCEVVADTSDTGLDIVPSSDISSCVTRKSCISIQTTKIHRHADDSDGVPRTGITHSKHRGYSSSGTTRNLVTFLQGHVCISPHETGRNIGDKRNSQQCPYSLAPIWLLTTADEEGERREGEQRVAIGGNARATDFADGGPQARCPPISPSWPLTCDRS